jgi:biopolymer transport protein ExbD
MRLTKAKRKFGSEINITPLIDIVFLLIIFSMVLSQFSKLQAEKLELPKAHKTVDPGGPAGGRVVVNVLSDGRIIVFGKGQSLESLDGLLAVRAERAGPEDVSVVIRGDRRTPWRTVSQIPEACAARRIDRVKVAAVEPGEASGP